jgi:hypothetical protein
LQRGLAGGPDCGGGCDHDHDLGGRCRRRATDHTRPTAGGDAAARARARAAAKPEQQTELRERAGWRQRGEPLVQAAELTMVRTTACAFPHVAARVPAHPHATVGGLGQFEADVLAWRVAGDLEVDEPGARPQQQRLHGRHRDAQRF